MVPVMDHVRGSPKKTIRRIQQPSRHLLYPSPMVSILVSSGRMSTESDQAQA